jgi:hypothetical protein
MNDAGLSDLAFLDALGVPVVHREAFLHYNQPWFLKGLARALPPLPLPAPASTAVWEQYASEARRSSWQEVLREKLPAFRFPVREGMSLDPDYRLALKKGDGASKDAHAFSSPDFLKFEIAHPPSGSVPVLTVAARHDFENLLRILLHRNEPVTIPPGMGAVLINGLTNHDRIDTLRRSFFASNPGARQGTWLREWERLREHHRDGYQDRLIVVSRGPYSALPAAISGMDDATWNECSRVIRIHHECAHAFCRAVLDHMGNNLLDECIADFIGMRAALGHFSCKLFLDAMGVSATGEMRSSGRMRNYLAEPVLPEPLHGHQARLLARAADTLASWDATLESFDPENPEYEARLILSLAACSLISLAAGAQPELNPIPNR